MRISRQAALLGFWLSCPLFAEARVLYDERQGGVARTVLLLAPEEFSSTHVQAAAKKFVRETSELYVANLVIFTNKMDAQLALKPKGYDFGYKTWWSKFNQQRSHIGASADVISLKGAAVLRFRGENGKTERIELSDKDPLIVRTSLGTIEIMQVAFPFFSPEAPPLHVAKPMLEFAAVTTAALTQELGKGTLAKLINAVPTMEVSVTIRHDAWFSAEEHFPVLYRFQNSLDPPPEADYLRSSTVYCQSHTVGGCLIHHPFFKK